MRWVTVRWVLVFGLLFVGAGYGCQFSCNTPQEFDVTAKKANVVEDGNGVTTVFDLKVVGVETEEKDGQHFIDVSIVMTVIAPDGEPLKLPGESDQRMENGYSEKIDFIEMKPNVQLPHNAPKGKYSVKFEVTDHHQDKSKSVDVEFTLD